MTVDASDLVCLLGTNPSLAALPSDYFASLNAFLSCSAKPTAQKAKSLIELAPLLSKLSLGDGGHGGVSIDIVREWCQAVHAVVSFLMPVSKESSKPALASLFVNVLVQLASSLSYRDVFEWFYMSFVVPHIAFLTDAAKNRCVCAIFNFALSCYNAASYTDCVDVLSLLELSQLCSSTSNEQVTTLRSKAVEKIRRRIAESIIADHEEQDAICHELVWLLHQSSSSQPSQPTASETTTSRSFSFASKLPPLPFPVLCLSYSQSTLHVELSHKRRVSNVTSKRPRRRAAASTTATTTEPATDVMSEEIEVLRNMMHDIQLSTPEAHLNAPLRIDSDAYLSFVSGLSAVIHEACTGVKAHANDKKEFWKHRYASEKKLQTLIESFDQALGLETILGDVVNENDKLYLYCDESTWAIPWEHMPSLSQYQMTRVVPKVATEKQLRNRERKATKKASKHSKGGFYVLNPNGDLNETEKRMSAFLSKNPDFWCQAAPLSSSTQSVQVGAPAAEESEKEAESGRVFLYCGHGFGTASVAVRDVFLMGCSSVSLFPIRDAVRIMRLHALSEQVPCEKHEYLPMDVLSKARSLVFSKVQDMVVDHEKEALVVGNLWDVTDKDLDSWTVEMLEQYHEMEPEVNDALDACRVARSSTRLRWLTGAAAVQCRFIEWLE
jgi:hypothetical protein